MKKHLLGTSALALGVALSAPASAQEWNMKWGGFATQQIFVGDVSGSAIPPGVKLDGDSVDIHSSSEIYFAPSITLDNGLTFGINIQFEGEQTANSEIDENYMSIYGDSFGRIDIGSENSAGYKLMVSAPEVSQAYVNTGTFSSYLPLSGVIPLQYRRAGISSYTEVGGNNDVQRITYYTPSFNGLTLGISYAPTGVINVANSIGIDRNAVLSDIWDFGVNYKQTFGTVDLALSARYGTGDAPAGANDDPETYAFGFNVGVSGWKFGATYSVNEEGNVGNFNDQEGYGVGISYDIPGPWTIGASGYFGEYDNTGTGGADEEFIAYKIDGQMKLGAGVTWDVFLLQLEGDDDGTAGTDLEGTFLGTGINLSF